MKTIFALMSGLAVALLPVQFPAAGASNEFPHLVHFELGDTEFAQGDSIEIREIRGTMATFTTNQTYVVTGTYTLGSADEAELAFFVTVPNSGPTPIDPRQRMRVVKGTGTFRLVKTMHAEGFPHLSFYPVPSGNSMGGVYFGDGRWLLRKKTWSSRDGEGGHAGRSAANQAMFDYLGEPVAPPPDLDSGYSVQGLRRAFMSAAQRAGLVVHKVQIDDTEYPFLLGVACSGDFSRVEEELKKMEQYDFTGSVGNNTHRAFNIVPWRTFPPDSAQRIGRRLTVRYQMLFDKISGH